VAKFPRDLADAVSANWANMVSGQYVTPPCPPKPLLRKILESCYLAAGAPEEARYPQFNVVVTAGNTDHIDEAITTYKFDVRREVSVEELRRLAPATDFRKSAIWLIFNDKETHIAGLCDLGTSLHRARLGLTYSYRVPSALLVQVDRPGRLKVYQGQFAVASLSDGTLSLNRINIPLFLHKVAHDGLRCLAKSFTVPELEQPRDFESFWFTALCNVFSAIANSISVSGHGGMLTVLKAGSSLPEDLVRTKYVCHSSALRDAFIAFINARNTTADFWTASETGESWQGNAHEAELKLISATEHLVEAIRFVAQMAGCDGAILLTSDLKLLGFGSEIRTEMAPEVSVSQVTDELHEDYRSCDLEQFGMRHRSAIKLVSRLPETSVLAVSQDGPISAVWAKDGSVIVRKGAPLGNMNIPWA
jgi:hypothetical protein